MRWPKDRLTRFEVARILGARTLQISLGAPILVKTTKDEVDSLQIAEKEFKEGKVPMTIKRPMPDGSKTIIDIKPAIKNWFEDYGGV